MRITEAEREALKAAAHAAMPVLAKLKEERDDLNRRITTLEGIISSYEDALGGRRVRRPPHEEADSVQQPRRGQVHEHIEMVLGSGGEFTEPELRSELAARFGVSYSRGTVYSALQRGKGIKFEVKEKRWRRITT
jgi:transposase